METTHTVISGSWALYALFPDAFIPGDLDLYTSNPKKQLFTPLIRYLIPRGYTIASLEDENYIAAQVDLEAADIGNIMKLSKKNIYDTRRHINIITSRSQVQIRPIFRFHSTVVMNYIASYGLVCLYPELTLHRRGLINDPAPSPHVHECVNKYRKRGFDMRPNLEAWDNTHVCSHSPDCPFQNRRLLDDSVLFVPFEEGRALADFTEDNRCILRVPCYSSEA
ncbi:hypothetical protein BJ912DRAFT_1086852 [Pholiota molesta]|nr:hypothetical protein BJ912DRAFT_1086852 [Pholiota molesta]